MRDYQRVIWAEGVFLGQQHFQLWDHYHARELVARDRAQRPFAWGVLDLAFEEAALARDELRLTRCELLLPDGRLVDYVAPPEAACSLTLPADGERVAVYAGLPANDSARGITGYGEPLNRCAWDVEYREIPDQHDVSRLREVALARPNLVLSQGDQPQGELASVQVLELHRGGDGRWQPDPAFVPAVCRLAASDALLEILQRIEERLLARIRVLDERRRRLGPVADFGPSELSQFLLLQVLGPGHGALAHHRHSGAAHPETVYLELVRLIAALAAFQGDASPAGLPAYDHGRLGEVFAACENTIDALLNDAVPNPMSGVCLEGETDALRVARSISPRLLQGATFFLAVRFEADDPAWVGDFARQIKIGAREDIEMILSTALQGVPARHVQRPPNRLPVKSGYEYFRIEAGGEFWSRVLEHQTLALLLPGAFASASIDLLTIED